MGSQIRDKFCWCQNWKKNIKMGENGYFLHWNNYCSTEFFLYLHFSCTDNRLCAIGKRLGAKWSIFAVTRQFKWSTIIFGFLVCIHSSHMKSWRADIQIVFTLFTQAEYWCISYLKYYYFIIKIIFSSWKKI